MDDITNVRGDSAHDPDSRYGADKTVKLAPQHPLDTEENIGILRQIECWWTEARDLQAENRREQLLDADFYDGDQYSDEDRFTLLERGQAPLVFNLVKPACDWIIGTERRTRVDSKVHPRGDEDREAAKAKHELLKYVSDANQTPWHRSAAFADAVKVGVGWMEDFVRADALEDELAQRHTDWKAIWWDAFSRSNDLSDCRYLHRSQFMDLDYALSLWPERADQLKAAAVGYMDSDLEIMQDEWDLPAAFTVGNSVDRQQRHFRFTGITGINRTGRQRVQLVVTWFRRPLVTKRIRARMAGYDEHDGKLFDANDAEVAQLVQRGVLSLTDAVTDKIWYALWIPGRFGTLLDLKPSPYKHNRFPYTPIWCYRRHRDGQPYGIVRQLRDPQEDYNKRRSKALFAMSTNRLMYEEGAINEADEDDFLDQASRPNAQMRVRDGALQNNRIKIETSIDVGQAHLRLMEDARQQVYEGSGVTRENLGQDTNATSGRAILAKQQQGAVTTAEVFDNYRLFIQLSGQKQLSLIEQYMTLPKKIRVLGPEKDVQFLTVNEPYIDPATGEVMFRNDVTKGQADFIVDQQDFRETVRMALAETLMETIAKMPPDLGLQLLDLAVDLMDIPNKEEIVARIRAMNGQNPAPPDPAQQAAQQQQQALQDQAAQLELQERQVRIGKEAAATEKLRAEARAKTIEGKTKALDTAGIVAAAQPLAPAADRLWEGASQ
jgi:hypothetical protein